MSIAKNKLVNMEDAQILYNDLRQRIESGGGGGGLPAGGSAGDVLIKSSGTDYAAAWVAPATSAEQDNTRPITAAAVYTEIGNINALLATI